MTTKTPRYPLGPETVFPTSLGQEVFYKERKWYSSLHRAICFVRYEHMVFGHFSNCMLTQSWKVLWMRDRHFKTELENFSPWCSEEPSLFTTVHPQNGLRPGQLWEVSESWPMNENVCSFTLLYPIINLKNAYHTQMLSKGSLLLAKRNHTFLFLSFFFCSWNSESQTTDRPCKQI